MAQKELQPKKYDLASRIKSVIGGNRSRDKLSSCRSATVSMCTFRQNGYGENPSFHIDYRYYTCSRLARGEGRSPGRGIGTMELQVCTRAKRQYT